MDTGDDRRSQELMQETFEQGRDLAAKTAELTRHEMERFVRESAPSLLAVGAGAVLAVTGTAACVAGLGGLLGRKSGFAFLTLGSVLCGAGAVMAASGLRDMPEGPLREEVERVQRDLGQTLRRRGS